MSGVTHTRFPGFQWNLWFLHQEGWAWHKRFLLSYCITYPLVQERAKITDPPHTSTGTDTLRWVSLAFLLLLLKAVKFNNLFIRVNNIEPHFLTLTEQQLPFPFYTKTITALKRSWEVVEQHTDVKTLWLSSKKRKVWPSTKALQHTESKTIKTGSYNLLISL